jgi:O-antigen ligase
MANTYNYLKIAFRKLKLENSRNPAFAFITLVALCIPMGYAVNSVALGLLVVYSLFTFKKSIFRIEKTLLLPVALFVLMSLSLTWTHDPQGSLRALSKGLPLLIIPMCLLILPPMTPKQIRAILKYFSYGMVGFTIFYLLKSIVRFALTGNTDVFFYHELVTEDVNAIHVSTYIVVALFYFITKTSRSLREIVSMILLTILLILLSSKNILIVFGLLSCYYLWYFNAAPKGKLIKWGVVLFVILIVALSSRIKQRLWIEFESNVVENSVNHEIGNENEKVYNVSVKDAWTKQTFAKNDFFPGTAFRIYQLRIFTEMLGEDPIFFTGYGLNATDFKIAQKQVEHNLYHDYGRKNFHNEYVQVFAELGIFGLVLLLIMVSINLRNALKSKDFMHISFAVLMISLFLTESFLSRQRGIIFFTIMYCLFNLRKIADRPQK